MNMIVRLLTCFVFLEFVPLKVCSAPSDRVKKATVHLKSAQSMSTGKCQRGSNLENWMTIIDIIVTDTHRIHTMYLLIMTFAFCIFDPR